MGKTRSGLFVGTAMLVLASCANTSVADEVYSGVPEGFQADPLTAETTALWIEENTRFAVVTYGSSSCPPVAEELIVHNADHLEIQFAVSTKGLCTADMAPTTHEFSLPGEVTSVPVEITIGETSYVLE